MTLNNPAHKKVFAEAIKLFEGDVAAAEAWLKTPQWGLSDKKPIELLDTDDGAESVLTLVRRIEYSVLS